MHNEFTVTRDEIVAAAMRMLGWRFRHQGRGEVNRVDCVGLLVCMGREIGYPDIVDLEGYRRTPSASELRSLLETNCQEIAVKDARRGDIYLMKLDGVKPRHTSIRISDVTDLPKGLEPSLIHAYGTDKHGRVKIDPVRIWEKKIVTAFRLHGVIENA